MASFKVFSIWFILASLKVFFRDPGIFSKLKMVGKKHPGGDDLHPGVGVLLVDPN